MRTDIELFELTNQVNAIASALELAYNTQVKIDRTDDGAFVVMLNKQMLTVYMTTLDEVMACLRGLEAGLRASVKHLQEDDGHPD